MDKIFVFSFDDGTVHDIRMIEILNKYGLRGTFNLNSGLNKFIWYNKDVPIYRIDLNEFKHIYNGHEVASHTLTHPHMTEIPDDRIVYEVCEDIKNLREIFNRDIKSFAFPFHDYSEREINIIKNNVNLTNIRLSVLDESFAFPKDCYHIPITSMRLNRAIELFKEFKKLKEGLFICAGHSYDFYMNNSFDEFEEFVKELSNCKDIKVMTMQEMVEYIKKYD